MAAKQDQRVRKPACEIPYVSHTISCFQFRGSEFSNEDGGPELG